MALCWRQREDPTIERDYPEVERGSKKRGDSREKNGL